MSIATDQSNNGTILGYLNTTGLGQEFQPSISTVDNVQFHLLPIFQDSYDPVDIAINIRDTTIAGAIVGTSGTVRIGNNNPVTDVGEVFTFSPPVSVTTGGHVYVFEFVNVAGPGNTVKAAYTAPVYGNGQVVINGVRNAAYDLWFVNQGG